MTFSSGSHGVVGVRDCCLHIIAEAMAQVTLGVETSSSENFMWRLSSGAFTDYM
jgi:hypothetical protein